MAELRHVQLIPAVGWVAVYAQGGAKPPYSDRLEDLIWTNPVVAWAIVAERTGGYIDDPEETRLTGIILDSGSYNEVPGFLREIADDEHQFVGYFQTDALNDPERLATLRQAAIDELEAMERHRLRLKAKEAQANA